MNATHLKRLTALEWRRMPTTIHLHRPEIELCFVSAEKAYPQDSGYRPEQSEKPTTTIELSEGESLNDVCSELGITADELHRQIKSGRVKIIYPPMPELPIQRQPVQVWWPIL